MRLLLFCFLLLLVGCGKRQDVAQVEDPTHSGWWLAVTEGAVRDPVQYGVGNRDITLPSASPLCIHITTAKRDGGPIRARIVQERPGLAPDNATDWIHPDSTHVAHVCVRGSL
jgi:hypothetical protein